MYVLLVQVTNQRLGGCEVCNCYRYGSNPSGRKLPVENRFYRNADNDIRVTYIQWNGKDGVSIQNAMWSSLLDKQDVLRSEGQCLKPYAKCSLELVPVMHITAAAFFSKILPLLQPHFVVANCGIHGCDLDKQQLAQLAVNALIPSSESRNVLWSTTTVDRGGSAPDGASAVAAFEAQNARVMPATAVTAAIHSAIGPHISGNNASTERMYADGVHLKQPVYQELTTVLLNILNT
jgi:hypothetical protein